jgi:hypothetical protein
VKQGWRFVLFDVDRVLFLIDKFLALDRRRWGWIVSGCMLG